MNKFKIALGAMALIVASVAIVACSKEKTEQKETLTVQHVSDPNSLTLAEIVEVMSWEDGKAFFENQSIKDYTYVCEKTMDDCGFAEKEEGLPFVISWELRLPNGDCDSHLPGSCLIIRKKEGPPGQENAIGYYEDGKLVIIPTTQETGFTKDGYLIIGSPIEVQNDSIIIQAGIYTAFFDEETGYYTAVAVDYYFAN